MYVDRGERKEVQKEGYKEEEMDHKTLMRLFLII